LGNIVKNPSPLGGEGQGEGKYQFSSPLGGEDKGEGEIFLTKSIFFAKIH